MKSPISDEYRNLLLDMRQKKKEWGSTGRKYGEEVGEWCTELGCRTVLDYGCGTESLRLTLPRGIGYAGYDPAVTGKFDLPKGEYDMVACIDVMEHVEEEHVESVLDQIFDVAEKAVYFLISCTPAKAILPDGRNAHITIKEAGEWFDLLTTRYDWSFQKSIMTPKFLKFIAGK